MQSMTDLSVWNRKNIHRYIYQWKAVFCSREAAFLLETKGESGSTLLLDLDHLAFGFKFISYFRMRVSQEFKPPGYRDTFCAQFIFKHLVQMTGMTVPPIHWLWHKTSEMECSARNYISDIFSYCGFLNFHQMRKLFCNSVNSFFWQWIFVSPQSCVLISQKELIGSHKTFL